MGNAKDRVRPPPDHQKDLVKAVQDLGYRHGHWQIFADFVEMAAISLSNAIDLTNRGNACAPARRSAVLKVCPAGSNRD